MPDHLTDEQLARCQDGDASSLEIQHLASCAECGGRFQDIQTATAAYVEYRDSIRGPMLPPPPQPWSTLDALIARHERVSLPLRETRRPLRWWAVSAAAAAICGAAVMAVVYQSDQPSLRATELLSRSAQASEVPGRRISIRTAGRTLMRPAVLTDETEDGEPALTRLRTLFDTAHYSWLDPLSPRSFQNWRSGVPHKRDTVTLVAENGQRSYRVRTETDAGMLHSASLTMRASDLRPTSASLDFENEGTVELAETQAPVEAPVPHPATAAAPPGSETPAGPEDTLRVLAALNGLGADVGEPVIVDDASHGHVVVHVNGLSHQRQQQIAQALKPLPHVVVDFDSVPGGAPPAQPAERYSSSIPAAVRTRLEEKWGGAVALQEATDRVLDASGQVLARTHAVQVLAEKFPPEVEARLSPASRELLLSLRQHHLAELRRLVLEMRAGLKPLLAASAAPTDNGTGGSWQANAHSLAACAQDTDQLLNRLLAGSYTQPAGEEMLRNLSPQMDRLESALQSMIR